MEFFSQAIVCDAGSQDQFQNFSPINQIIVPYNTVHQANALNHAVKSTNRRYKARLKMPKKLPCDPAACPAIEWRAGLTG